MTPMRPRHALGALLALGALTTLTACGDDPLAPLPAPAANGDSPGGMTPVADDGGAAPVDPPPRPLTKEELEAGRKRAAAVREDMNRLGRELLASFEGRTYSPVKNVGVTYAEGRVMVKTAGVEATYAFTFDASKDLDQRTIVTRTDKSKDGTKRPNVPTGTAKQISDFAQLSLNGAYRFVVNYLPPTQVLLTPAKKGTNKVVTAQQHKHPIQTSYSVDERDLVVIRGTSVRTQSEIVYFAWEEWRGRYLLKETTFHGTDAVTELEYEETDDAVLLSRAKIRKDGAGWDATFTYDRIDRDDPEDPLQAEIKVVPPPEEDDGK